MQVNLGDVVHVRVLITDVHPEYDGDIKGRSVTSGRFRYVDTNDIVKVEPRPLQVGDEVTWGFRAVNYKVVAIHEKQAWLQNTSKSVRYATMPLADLVRVA